MESNPLVLSVLVPVLIWAMWTDLMRREIPNGASIAAAAAIVAGAFLTGSIGQIAWESALLILIVGFILSAFMGVIGAGDVKLLAALSLGFPGATLEFLLYTAWAGGILAVLVLIWNFLSKRESTGLPYGIAIGSAAFVMFFNQLPT